MLLAGSAMPDWSARDWGQTKQHPGPPDWGLGVRPAFSPQEISLIIANTNEKATRDFLFGRGKIFSSKKDEVKW